MKATTRLRPTLEALEERTMLSTCHVTRLGDAGGGFGLRGDLRYCINKVNDLPGPDMIDIRVTGVIKLSAELPNLASDITIVGAGADLVAVDANSGLSTRRVFTVNPGATVKILNLTMKRGAAFEADGGGIHNSGNLTLVSCTVSDNYVEDAFSDAFGGGIYNAGTLFLRNSTVANNTIYTQLDSDPYGAGIFNSTGATATMLNSTISSNNAQSEFDKAFGGGVANAGALHISFTTIAFNRIEGQGTSQVGGIYSTGILTIRNTIVSNNEGTQLAGSSSGDHNIVMTNALLGPLADNGGPTLTHALLPGSPAIDAGDNADAPPFDQRGPGFPRIVNGTVDIGAFEVQATGAPLPTNYLVMLITADLSTDDMMDDLT